MLAKCEAATSTPGHQLKLHGAGRRFSRVARPADDGSRPLPVLPVIGGFGVDGESGLPLGARKQETAGLKVERASPP
jgi:hypothetical protein